MLNLSYYTYLKKENKERSCKWIKSDSKYIYNVIKDLQ